MSICRALPRGRSRGSSAGEPPPAARPSMASGWPKVAVFEAMMKSVLWASSQPPPYAIPLTAVKIGLRSWRTVYNVQSKACRWRSQSSLVIALRWRRSLPTEKARSPAPVRTTTRTVVRTAMSSIVSVSRAPISVLIALSTCGRLRVTRAIRPSSRYSRSTDASVSSTSGAGGAKSSAAQRSVLDELMVFLLSVADSSGVQLRDPAQRSQARREAVLASPGHHERRQVLQPAADRSLRNREDGRVMVRADEGIGLERRTDEDAVVEPLGLHELELTFEVGTGEHEHDPAVDTVVLDDAVGEHRSVARAAPDHPVQPHVHTALAVQPVAGIRSARVSTDRALEPARVVTELEVVVAQWIRSQVRVVRVRGQCERRATLP